MITSKEFGKLNSGETVMAYTMKSKSGVEVTVLDLGGIIQSIKVPDRNGVLGDVVCGYDNPQEYLDNSGYNGAIIGRYANRIKNGEFTLNGVKYTLPKNENGKKTLHGGNVGFDKRFWNVEAGECSCGADRIKLTYFSPDGEEGFPGNVEVKVIYRLDDKGEFAIRYFASSDKETPISMTNHAYFNLAGYQSQNVLEHELQLNCGHIVAVDSDLIPTEITPVDGTAFDFRTSKTIGRDIKNNEKQLVIAGGYDHSFVIESEEYIEWNHGLKLAKTAHLRDPESGRCMTLYTNAVGVQVYSGNFMSGLVFKNGVESKNQGAVCLETGFYPDTPNRPDFPSCNILPGKDLECTAVFKFGIE